MAYLFLQGDARKIDLPDQSVHCCVTSPPYFNLRDYGIEGQIGLERTPSGYIQNLVEVFREVRRVLRDDGTLWIVIGDTYATDTAGWRKESWSAGGSGIKKRSGSPEGAKPKDLLGIPWLLAFALRDDGWYLRSDCIWSKRNPMRESVTDRPTKSHEYLFLFSKSKWKTRVVQLANLDGERFHLLKDFRSRRPLSITCQLCVELAASILDLPQFQNQPGLPTLDPEIWQEASGGDNRLLVGDVPVIHPATILASRFLAADATTKEFLCELYRLGVTLPEGHDLLIGGVVPLVVPVPPGIFCDGKTSIGIHHAGQICKVDFSHGTIVTKRPSNSNYYYDKYAIMTPSAASTKARLAQDVAGQVGSTRANGGAKTNDNMMAVGDEDAANKLSVWDVPTKPLKIAHFATFPPALIEPCVKAGTSEKGCCPKCGAPWKRVVKKTRVATRPGTNTKITKSEMIAGEIIPGRMDSNTVGNRDPGRHVTKTVTVGWESSCTCLEAREPRPCTVLDPFGGAMTTSLVSEALGRDSVCLELKREYIEIGHRRMAEAKDKAEADRIKASRPRRQPKAKRPLPSQLNLAFPKEAS